MVGRRTSENVVSSLQDTDYHAECCELKFMIGFINLFPVIDVRE